jgi:hypothetical protein
MTPHTDHQPALPETFVTAVFRALLTLPDTTSRDLLREALFSVTAARDTSQQRLRLTLLASLCVELFRHDPPRAMTLLRVIEQTLEGLPHR